MRYAADGLLSEHIGSREKASDHSLSFYSFGFEKAKDTAGYRAHYLIIIVGEKKPGYYGHAMSIQKGTSFARILPGSGKTLQKI